MEFKRYFQPYAEYFWHLKEYWQDFDGSNAGPTYIYEIPEGSTIAYADYIVEITEAMALQSLPPFGSLLLAIVATNHDPHGALAQIREILKSKEVTRAFPNANLHNVDAAYVFLHKLVTLPQEYKTREKRMLLFQTIFKDCHNRISGDVAKQIAADFKNNRYDFFASHEEIKFNASNFVKDIKTLALLNTQFPLVQSIIKAMEGLPDTEEFKENLHEDITDQNITSEQQKDFVDQLIENDKTFHIGSLVTRLWSGLKIPLHHNLPSNQPLGGIADITNKGDFDKLLISEFANDDLVFMSRIANNEALYIEREIPPEEDKFTRDILIDTSLKNWGNPKIVAFATALAIAKHPKTEIECNLYVLGSECEEVKCNSIHEVIDGLNLLSGKIDCSEGLTQYFSDNAFNKAERETFLIVSEESYKSVAFQKVLHENFESIHYILTTTINGEISFYKIANRGRKLIQKIQLPLEELWRKNKKHNSRIIEPVPINEIPILYPLERNYKDIFHYGGVYYAYSNGNLFEFVKRNTDKGFIKIAANIPFKAGKYALYENNSAERILVNSNDYDQTVSKYNVDTGKLICEATLEVKVATIILFPVTDSICFTDNADYWKIEDSGKVIALNDATIGKTYDQYYQILENFIRLYSSTRTRFNVVRKLESVYFNHNHEIEFNDFALVENKLRDNYYYDYSDFHSMQPLVNLIYKRNGSNKIESLKVLKSEANFSLKEASDIIDGQSNRILTNANRDFADDVKDKIEDTGAVCYIEQAMCQSNDGSTVICRDGILELESSDKNIPKFYIPFVSNRLTAMATDGEFAGNEYFLPEDSPLKVIPVAEFHDKYIKPFVKNILENGIDAEAE